MELVDALGVREGLTAVVGAGGKKTLIYALGNRLERAAITATVRIPIFDDHVRDMIVTEDPIRALETAEEWPVGLAPKREDDRYIGYDPSVLDDLQRRRGREPTLAKADGARSREFKAPGKNEPRIPDTTDTVVAVASVAAIGAQLRETTVHRPERVAELTGLSIGDVITPEDVATVLASDAGGRKNVPRTARFVPLLNKVDGEEDEQNARRVAALLKTEPAVDQVALTSLIDTDTPLVDVVR